MRSHSALGVQQGIDRKLDREKTAVNVSKLEESCSESLQKT